MPGILGIITSNPNCDDPKAQLFAMLHCMRHESFYTYGAYIVPEQGCYLGWVSHKDSFSDCNPIVSPTRDTVLIFSGEDFARQGSASKAGKRFGYDGANASYLLSLYEERGENFLLDLNGWFAGVLVDLRERSVLVFNDRFGVHRIYYNEDKDSFAFSSEAKSLLSVRPETRKLDARALGQFLGSGSVFQNRTLFSDIFLLPGGSAWTLKGPSDIKKRHYFNASIWEEQPALAEDTFYTGLRNTIVRTLPKYFYSRNPIAVSLTGGLDTRILMAGRPRLFEPMPCYTYGGIYRDCFDVHVAQDVAGACGERHHVIALGPDFFDDFATFAEQTVWYTDGCLDICGAHEVYFSRRAREIAPVRLTGNYGSEILRSVSTFKYAAPPEELFDAAFVPHIREAVTSFAEIHADNRVSFAAFKEIPWHLHGRLAAAQSQLIVRSPFMDNELVSLMYRARPQFRQTNEMTLRLISEMDPSLSVIGTDMGYAGSGSHIPAYPRRLYRYLLFKAEWYYNAGMPHWLSRFDRRLMTRLERFFLGSHKIEHYRIWFRDQLFDYVQSVLSDPATATRPYLDRRSYRALVTAHRKGRGNYMNEISRIITLELVHRLLIDGGARLAKIGLDKQRVPKRVTECIGGRRHG